MALNMNSHLKKGTKITASDKVKTDFKKQEHEPEGNRYLNSPELGLQLLAQLVKVGGNDSLAHKKLNELATLIETQYLPLTETDHNTTGATTYRDLRKICFDLEALIQCPEIERHYTVAIGGMFSSGKSRFLNAILGCDLLPTDTNPTTSIPTYLTQGNVDAVAVLNKFHSRIAIDEAALQAICHAFHERFNVSFAHILRLVHVQRKQMKFPDITFLDTPGYSKSDSLSAANNIDEGIAREHLRRADYLIWLIDIQNGTVPLDDLLFIRSLDFRRPILFILNKADKKTDNEIEQALAAARKDLAKASDIQAYGVTAYSAAEGREYGDQNCLSNFLLDVSQRKSGSPLCQKAGRIFSHYIAFYESEKIRLRQQRGILNEATLSTASQSEWQEQAKALAAGTLARIEELQSAEKKMETIRREALRLIEQIADASGLILADEYVPMLSSMTRLSSESYKFQGVINKYSPAVWKELLSKSSLNKVSGKVRKIDSLCVYFDMEYAGLETMVAMTEIQKIAKLKREDIRDFFPVGAAVRVQLCEEGRCIITYPPLD